MRIVELRQDRGLIRSNFDGYKLSLDAVPVLRQDLAVPPQKATCSSEQYALLHVELFSRANLLQADPFARNTAYHVNRQGEVMRNGYDENIGRPEALQAVYRVAGARQLGDYNYSMSFVSEKYCVLCDGITRVLLLDTGDRLKKCEWKAVAVADIASAIAANEAEASGERGYTLFDARLDVLQEQKHISLALGRVQRIDTPTGGTSHCMRLHWAKWVCTESSWALTLADALQGKGSIYYCAFEPRAESLIVSSNRPLQFMSVSETQPQDEAATKPQLHDEATYSWTQSDDDVVVRFTREGGHVTRNDFNIKSTAKTLSVKYLDDVLLDDELCFGIDDDLTTWTMENSTAEITLTKANSSQVWPTLLANGAGPSENTENGNHGNLGVEQQPIANLEAPIEDCDFPINDAGDDIKIERFHLSSRSITHAVLLGATPPLFATNLRPGFPDVIVTRQDVDASLWLQQYNAMKPDEWCLRHEGNLHAFGYVQASKQQKKFMDCSPDMGYAVICESYRHVFLYKSQYDTANGLRNRAGAPQVTIGKQHLITLPVDVGEVLGLTAACSVVIILTENAILYLQMS